MSTIKTLLDGVLLVKPLSYVLGEDWTYLYSDVYKGVEYDVHACMNGEVVAVLCWGDYPLSPFKNYMRALARERSYYAY